MRHSKYYLIGLLLFLLLSSCEKDESTINYHKELEATWFRSYPNRVWGGRDQPSFERGETHIRITFKENGEFIYNRTVLGLYEGTTIDDTTAIVIESGTFQAYDSEIDILLTKRLWWDSWYEDMDDFAESGVNATRYMDVTYDIMDDELNLIYYTQTDIVSDEQEIRGFDKYDEIYTKL